MARKRGNNEGTIYRRKDGLWCVQVSLDGHRLTKYYHSQAECREWLRETLDKIRGGMTRRATMITVEDYLEHFLDGKELSRRAKTVVLYKQVVNQHINPKLGKNKLQDLRPGHITTFYAALKQNGIGARMLQLTHAVLNCALNQAVREGIIGRNPVDAVERPRFEAPEHAIWTDTQARQFLAAAKGHRFEAMFQLALTTGMREGELLGLKWSDVDWKKASIRVQRQLQRDDEKGLILVPPKTKSGVRQIKLGNASIKCLSDHQQRQAIERQAAGDKWQANDLIFPTGLGTPFDHRNMYRAFKDILKSANVPDIRFHDLRHTSISLLLGEGVDLNTVQNRAGHARASITSDIYGHALAKSQDKAAQLLDDLMTPIDSEGGLGLGSIQP